MTMVLNGAVECREGDSWFYIMDPGDLVRKLADINGPFFGVDNHSGLPPLFADRGWPPDISLGLECIIEDRQGCHYLVQDDGQLVFQNKSLHWGKQDPIGQKLERDPSAIIHRGDGIPSADETHGLHGRTIWR